MNPPEIVRTERQGTLTICHVTGEIDETNAGDMRDELLDARQDETSRLVIDISDMRFVDSAGIARLFEAIRGLRQRRVDVAAALPESGVVRRALEFSRLGEVVPLYTTVDAAVDDGPDGEPGGRPDGG